MEDNPTDIFVISQILKDCNLEFHPRVVTDGAEALAAIQEAIENPSLRPSLILLDLNLPKIPGLEVLRAIRAIRSLDRVPIVVVTSSESDQDRRDVSALGVEGYFRKPTMLTEYLELGELIARVMAGR